MRLKRIGAFIAVWFASGFALAFGVRLIFGDDIPSAVKGMNGLVALFAAYLVTRNL